MKKFGKIFLRTLSVAMIAAVAAVGAACGNTGGGNGGGGGTGSGGTEKNVNGIPPVFAKDLGYNTANGAAWMETDTEGYIVYETNEVKNEAGSVFAIRSIQKGESGWTAGEEKVVLRPSEDAWDSYAIGSPEVVKGEFAYDGTTYSYLMVYSGRNIEKDRNNAIGAAVATDPAGEWVKIPDPILTYDKETYGSAFGFGSPSVVSLDKGGNVELFVTYADTARTTSRGYDLDCSDLSDIKGSESWFELSEDGLFDNDSVITFNNAGFAMNDGDIVCVRDMHPYAAEAPTVATSLQVVKTEHDNLYCVDCEWDIVERFIDSIATATEDNLGWERIFSGSLLRDAYGALTLNGGKYTVLFTSSETEHNDAENYAFSQALHFIELTY